MNKKILSIIMLLAVLAISTTAVNGSTQRGVINVDLLSQNPDPAFSGSYVELRFRVENIGDAEIRNILFELIPEQPFSLDADDDGKRRLDSLSARQIGERAYIIFYRVKIAENAIGSEYDIYLRYTVEGATRFSTVESFKVRTDTRTPLVVIDSVKTEPGTVGFGEPLKLKIGIENLANSPINNLRMNLHLVSSQQVQGATTMLQVPFAPIGSTNEKIIRTLGAGERRTVEFDLIADVGAEPGVHRFPVTLTYEDNKGQEYTSQGIVSIMVGQAPDMMVSIDNREPFIIGKSDTLEIRFTNKGLTDIKLLTAAIQQNEHFEVLSSEKVYVGNIDSDDYRNADYRIRCKGCDGSGFMQIPIVFEFLDANNNRYTEEIVLKHRVYTTDQALEQGLIQKSNTVGYLITLAIVILGIVAYRIIRKRRKDQ